MLQQARRHDDDLDPSPINPDWVREGDPQARVSKFGASVDGMTGTYVWSCTAGAFDWTFGCDEVVHVVEGSVTVTSPDGETTTLYPGDSCFFPAGTTWFWRVDEYVRKHAVLVTPLPTPVRAGLAAARRAKNLLRRRPALVPVPDAVQPVVEPAPVEQAVASFDRPAVPVVEQPRYLPAQAPAAPRRERVDA